MVSVVRTRKSNFVKQEYRSRGCEQRHCIISSKRLSYQLNLHGMVYSYDRIKWKAFFDQFNSHIWDVLTLSQLRILLILLSRAECCDLCVRLSCWEKKAQHTLPCSCFCACCGLCQLSNQEVVFCCLAFACWWTILNSFSFKSFPSSLFISYQFISYQLFSNDRYILLWIKVSFSFFRVCG